MTRINWPAVVLQIQATSLSLGAIAVRTELGKSTVWRIANGVCEPLHDSGERIIGVWCERVAKSREQLPRS